MYFSRFGLGEPRRTNRPVRLRNVALATPSVGRRRRAPTLQKATPLACAAIVVASFPKLFSNVSLWPRRVNALSLSGACCSHTSSDFKKWLHLSSRARVNISRNFDTQRRTPLHANTQLLKQLPLCCLSSVYITEAGVAKAGVCAVAHLREGVLASRG